MPDFCPFDFKEYDPDNMAYELFFADNWTWDMIKKQTTLGAVIRPYINENDCRRHKHYRQSGAVEHIILQENSIKGKKNGLTLLKESIEKGNQARQASMKMFYEEACRNAMDYDFGERDTYRESDPPYLKYSPKGEDDSARDGFAYDCEDMPIPLHHEIINGIDTFLDENRDVVMYALPCCPYCHSLLPIGWKDCESYLPIAFLSRNTEGSSVLQAALYRHNWQALQNYSWEDAIRISGATYSMNFSGTDDECDGNLASLEKNIAPGPTPPLGWPEPVFFHCSYKGHTLIAGIYDFAFEALTGNWLFKYGNYQKTLLSNMKDFYFLFGLDGCQNNTVRHTEAQEKSGNDLHEKVRNYLDLYAQMVTYGIHPEEKRVRGILTKCDCLYSNPFIMKKYADIFQPEYGGPVSMESIYAKSSRIEEMLITENFLTEEEIQYLRTFMNCQYEEAGGNPVKFSWSCVSGLGTDVDPHSYHLNAQWTPINVQDPVLASLLAEIHEMGWNQSIPQPYISTTSATDSDL